MAIGWDNGEILIWNEHERELFHAAEVHKADISLVHWTSLGTRLLTADSVSLDTHVYKWWSHIIDKFIITNCIFGEI